MRNTTRRPRENRTITVDFQNEVPYCQLLGDGKAFVELVIAFVMALGFQLAHKATCHGHGCLTRHSHYARSGWVASPSGGSSVRRAKRYSPCCRISFRSIYRTL